MPRLPLLKHPVLHYKNKWLHHKCKYADTPQGTVIGQINGVKFPFDFTLGKMVKNMYFGSYDFEIRRILEKYLKPAGVFIDIGANVGYLTAVGASLVGKTGQVHSFEPVPKYFSYIQQTVDLNPEYKILANGIALGEKTGFVRIANHKRNIGGNSIVPGFVPKEDTAGTFNIQVQRLDAYIQKMELSQVSLIKIDTEGFELPVLLGTSCFFEKHKGDLPPIIAEVTPRAFKLMKRDVSELDDFMSGYGYKAYAICGRHRINVGKINTQTNVLFKK
jgi:FkbM family methyltransferase